MLALVTLLFDLSGKMIRACFFPFFPASSSKTLVSSSLTERERAFSLRLNRRPSPFPPESLVLSSESARGGGGGGGGGGGVMRVGVLVKSGSPDFVCIFGLGRVLL